LFPIAKRVLNGTSLRAKFMVAPVTALIALIVLSAVFMQEMSTLTEHREAMQKNDLVIISGLTEFSVDISRFHSKIYDILLMAQDGADEERIYEYGKPVLEGLVALERHLAEAHELSSGPGMEQKMPAWQKFSQISESYASYKNTAITAIEMSTVNSAGAKEQLFKADDIYNRLILAVQEGLGTVGKTIASDFDKQQALMDATSQVMMSVAIVAIMITFLSGLYLSGALGSELDALIKTMTELSGGDTDVDIPRISTGKELVALANGVGIFRDSLKKNFENKIELEQNNILLKWEIDGHRKTEADLRETRSRFQYLLDHSPAMIYSAVPSDDGIKVTYISENAQKILGQDVSGLLCDRRLWVKRLGVDDGAPFFSELSTLYKQGQLTCEYHIKTKEGKSIWIHDELKVSRYDRGVPVEMLGSLSNVTELKKAEQKLQAMNYELLNLASSLEDKVALRTADLEKANQELRRLSEAKSEFVSIVSHDLRTPLTGVKLFTDIMLDGIDDIDKETQVEYLSIISSETDRLSRLITNILDFQKISAGKMQWNDALVDVVEVIDECVRPFKVSFESKGIAFGFNCDLEKLETVIDGDRLAQVVYNLLSNALKFTDEGSVQVDLKLNETVDGDRISLTVSDTGPGMPQDQLKKVFEPFEQYDGVPNLGKGTGLGLYITSCVVDRYHGRAWAESVENEGTSFHVELPVRLPEAYVI
jgi:signal transduction histidine kinase/HAMP domain-containing protein